MAGWRKNGPPVPEQELREALIAAHEALMEIAMTKGLDPNGERARDLCDAAVRKLDAGAHLGRGRGRV